MYGKSHPSGSSQCTRPEHPVSCTKPGLAIHSTYDNIHVSMLFSQIIPPCLLPQSLTVYSLYLCLFCCLAYRVIITIFLNSIYMCSVQFSRSVVSDSLRTHDRSTPGLPVHHQLPEFTQGHVHRVSDAIQPSHPLSSPSPPAPNPSQHHSLFQ